MSLGGGAGVSPPSGAGLIGGEAGPATSPGGGRLQKVEKARVGTELCRVEVRGEACIWSKTFADTVIGAAGKKCEWEDCPTGCHA